MAGTRSTNTMAEGLPAIMSMIQELKLAPDADLPWLIGLETQIIQKVQSQYGASDQAAQMGGPPGNAEQAPPGVSGGPMPMPTGVGGGVPMPSAATGGGPAVGGRGVRAMPAPVPPVSPDEMRRLLTPGPQGG